jgi:predicted XRE-type DNA-binding protein
MKDAKLEVVRGSGNVFRDLGHENADAEQFKAILAAEIIKALDRDHLTVRAAHERTGIAAADFSRLRNADLGRFTIDRMMGVINRLGSRIEVKIRVRRVESVPHQAKATLLNRHWSKEIKTGTYESILKDLGIKEKR